jgi:hypothetical protein
MMIHNAGVINVSPISKLAEELLNEYRHGAGHGVKSIVKVAEERGMSVTFYTDSGRFAVECLKLVDKEDPEPVMATRSNMSQWVRRFLGAPVECPIDNAKWPVSEA